MNIYLRIFYITFVIQISNYPDWNHEINLLLPLIIDCYLYYVIYCLLCAFGGGALIGSLLLALEYVNSFSFITPFIRCFSMQMSPNVIYCYYRHLIFYSELAHVLSA